MRIGDCVGLQTGHLADNKLFLNTQKSGSKIFVPLPPTAVQALKTVHPDGNHYFWTGKGLRKSAVADWQRALRRVFKLAKVDGNPHMFRHTFATTLLAKGIPIEDVSALLGHKSVRITEAYYSHWIRARRERLLRNESASCGCDRWPCRVVSRGDSAHCIGERAADAPA